MHKDQREELQRLEEALLEADPQAQAPGASNNPSVTDEEFDLWLKEFLSDVNIDYTPKPTTTPQRRTTSAPVRTEPAPVYAEESASVYEAATIRTAPVRPAPVRPAPAPQAYETYNTDETDVEPDDYTEELEAVQDKKRTPVWLILFCILVIGGMVMFIWYLLNVLRMIW